MASKTTFPRQWLGRAGTPLRGTPLPMFGTCRVRCVLFALHSFWKLYVLCASAVRVDSTTPDACGGPHWRPLQGWASRTGKKALIVLTRTVDFDLSLEANDECNPGHHVLHLLTSRGTERLLGARVKDLHDEHLRLVDVLTWFDTCFRNGPEDWSLSKVCVKKLPPLHARARTHTRTPPLASGKAPSFACTHARARTHTRTPPLSPDCSWVPRKLLQVQGDCELLSKPSHCKGGHLRSLQAVRPCLRVSEVSNAEESCC
jgi:hypothetical protein